MRVNPILVKELRSRMRGPRAFVILTLFLLLLGAFAYGLYDMLTFSWIFSSGGPPLGAVVGYSVFTGLALFELTLVCIITPALTANAISSEVERRTLDMLLATPLSSAAILWGKLISALSYVFLLILAAVPMASIVFIFGGVTLTDILRALGILVICALTLGILGLFFSTWLRRGGRATVASYIILLLLALGTYFLYIVVGIVRNATPPRAILLLNPVAAMASALSEDMRWGMFMPVTSPFVPLVWTLSGNPMDSPQALKGNGPGLRPLWHYTAGLYAVIALGLYLASVQMLKPSQRWRLRRAEILKLMVLLLALIGIGYALYGPPSYARFGSFTVTTPTPMPLMMAPAVPERVSLKPAPTPISTLVVETTPDVNHDQ
ncbi:MAG: ABC transporter permease [Anaerolineae bacterium]|nr:ABC transporter permease [Anaerolineae bacterium]MDW8098409.1 ABC transporter permease [Anaerolineae bacterium]